MAWRQGRITKITTGPETEKTVTFEERGFPCVFEERYEDLTAKRGFFDRLGIVINAVAAIVVSILLATTCELWFRQKDRLNGPGSTPA